MIRSLMRKLSAHKAPTEKRSFILLCIHKHKATRGETENKASFTSQYILATKYFERTYNNGSHQCTLVQVNLEQNQLRSNKQNYITTTNDFRK